ncbi:transketolase family protein [Lysinibacillus sp. NPDC056232]|uniref:transketolase family protein n=1 Tax=Lysinibacillus sp. NPDC056232 TaxID=3345756 RepID=UPI0035DFEEC0
MNKTLMNPKMLARLGQRGTFGMIMLEKAKENEDLIVLTADVSIPAGLDRFRKQFSNQFIDVGIAEQNMIGIAAGLASEGFDVYTTTYAPFQTLRCLEQIRVNIGEMKYPVRMVGLSSGVVLGMIGNMHCSFEDIAVMRAIPNIIIISPADSFELVKVIEALDNYLHPVYIRLTSGAPAPIVYKEDYTFEIGKAVQLKKGKDIVFFATGSIIDEALKAAEILESENINTEVINIHTIRPIDEHGIQQAVTGKKLIVTIEEHLTSGGLGSVISEVLSLNLQKPPQLMIGLPSDYSKAGIYEEMLEYYGLTANAIAKKVKSMLNKLQ